jgi:chromosome segregation ATPase
VITHDRDLCCNCFDYKAIPVKNKSQVDMGRRFQCRWPEGKKASTNDNSFIVVHKKKRPASKDNNDENATPAPKKRRSSIQQLQKKLSSTEQKLSDSNGEKIQWKARYNDLLTDSAASEVKADRLEAWLKELESEVITVKAKLAAAEEQVIKANSSERRLYKKLRNLEKLNGVPQTLLILLHT